MEKITLKPILLPSELKDVKIQKSDRIDEKQNVRSANSQEVLEMLQIALIDFDQALLKFKSKKRTSCEKEHQKVMTLLDHMRNTTRNLDLLHS